MFLQNDTVISGRYRIIEQIGIGGMAVVYKALDIKLDRAVTLKVLKEEFIADEEFLKRFSVEAKAAAKLNHPNIVSAYDVGEDGNIHYIVMEYIDGYTLKELIKKKAPFSNEEALGVAIQIATGLEAAHSCGIIHRDIKPQNILVTKEGSIKVTDFGIARTAGSNTITADSIGSVHYFSPEQARSGFVDYKSDIYSLGIILFEMVTGVVPFEGESAVELAMKHIEEPLPDMKALNPNISDSVVKIILKATEKKASQRYQSAYEMNDNLKRALTNATGDFVRRENKPDLSQTVRVGEEELAAIRQMTGGKNMEELNEADGSDSSEYNEDIGDEKYNDDMEEEDIDEYDDEEEYDDEYEDDDEDDEREVKKRERRAAIAAIFAALIVIAGITAVGINFLNERNDGDYSEVPQLVGLTWDEAVAKAGAVELYVANKEEEYSNEYEEGKITSQEIERGQEIRKGSTIYVKVSKGSDMVTIPDVVDSELADAYDKFSDVAVKITEEYVSDSDKEIGIVVKQEPQGGAKVAKFSDVILYISRGKENVKVTVPNVVGRTQEEAEKLLKSANLIVGSVIMAESADTEKGKVVKQGIPAGEQVNSGYSVTLVISSGAPEVIEEEETEAEIEEVEKTELVVDENSEEVQSVTEESAEETVNPDDNEQVEEAPMKTEQLDISPRIEEGEENADVKITSDTGDGEKIIYSANRNADEFPFSLPVSGNTTTVYRIYVNDVPQGETTVYFN